MDIKEHINYWLASASDDLAVADTLFQNQKYDWCLFVAHLVLEKTIKAIYVRDNKTIPPLTHNLVRLAENTKLQFANEQLLFLADVNDFNIESRYPDFKFSFHKMCTKEFTEKQFFKIKEIYGWLLSLVK